jgi:hypothetical protein
MPELDKIAGKILCGALNPAYTWVKRNGKNRNIESLLSVPLSLPMPAFNCTTQKFHEFAQKSCTSISKRSGKIWNVRHPPESKPFVGVVTHWAFLVNSL